MLLLAGAAGLSTGAPTLFEYAVPLALAGLVATFVGVRRFERRLDRTA